MEKIAESLWLLRYPMKRLGVDLNRNVTVIRLPDGKLVIHSTAPFSSRDVQAIRALGEPAWILDALSDHDTFAAEGRAAFRSAHYLGPEGFTERVGFTIESLLPAPEAWAGVLEVKRLEGTKGFDEHVILHCPSSTLIVCDLLLNFPDSPNLWASALLRLGLGPERAPGVSRRLKLAIRDRSAFARSLDAILEWDFDKIIVGHGDPILSDGKRRAAEAWRALR